MATILEWKMAQQASDTVFAVLRDARLNAQASKDEIGVRPIAEIEATHNANADQYLRLFLRITSRAAYLTSALNALGIDVPNITPYRTAIQTYRAAPKTTAQEITDAADALLAAIPQVVDFFRD